MSDNILFIFEGKRDEPKISDALANFCSEDKFKSAIKVMFCGEIYQLYRFIIDPENEDCDVIELLKEREGCKLLAELDRESISEIYLFFDYDGHAQRGKDLDHQVAELINFFDDETGNGKLFVSYPMVESIKHLEEGLCFSSAFVPAKENIKYKKQVNDKCLKSLQDFKNVSEENWKLIVKSHNMKAQMIVNDEYAFPTELIEQIEIFESQLAKFIENENQVGVLCGFPLLITHYFGVDKTLEMVS